MKPLEFQTGDLVKLGPSLWGDVWKKVPTGYDTFFEYGLLTDKIALYIKSRIVKEMGPHEDLYHEVLYDNTFYVICDNSFAVEQDSRRNLQKVTIDD